MFPTSIARIVHTRMPRAATKHRILLSPYIQYHNVGSRLRTSAAATTVMEPSLPISMKPTTVMKRRRCFPSLHYTQHQNHSFSTTSKPSTTDTTTTKTKEEELPAVATTGNIASHLAPIPTERDIAMVGGVFSVTSAKRDKLTELNRAMSEEANSLDDMATDEEKLDLHLADGIKLIASLTDSGSDITQSEDTDKNVKVLKDFMTWLDNQKEDLPDNDQINKTAVAIKFELISAKLDNLLESLPPSHCLKNIRDYQDPAEISKELKDCGEDEDLIDRENQGDSESTLMMDCPPFRDAVTRYRLLLAKSAVDQIIKSWKILTTVSDADIDRAAVDGVTLEAELDTVSFSKIIAFLRTNISGSCSDRFTAAWDLMDRDQDGSLDEVEMNEVVHLCLGIEVEAVQALFKETLDAFPVRAPLSAIGADDIESVAPQGWREKRKEKKTKKQLLKMFQKSCQQHFDLEVEINHRLRCIYAWANKASQDNQLRSVVVDEQAGWSGQKRYVELSPKISEAEFREVQEIHFKHLDRLGGEILKSFREDLWVLQGTGRERKELIRNSVLFLAGVSAIDFVILSL